MASLTIDDALQLATGHFQAGRTDAAKAALDAILGEAPDCADAHNLLGLTAHKTGALEAALTSIGEAVRLVPKDANYISNLGVVHKTRGDLGRSEADPALLTRALACFDRIAASQPGFHGLAWSRFRGLRERARLELDGGDLDTALATCEKGEAVLAGADWQPAGATLAASGVQSSLQTFLIANPPAISFGAASVKTYKDARLLPGDREWFLADGGDIHLTDMANTTPEVSPYVIVAGAHQAVLRMPADVVRFSDAPLFLVGGSRNYYHWMLDYLPRLALAGEDVKLLVMILLIKII